jgi:signal transduction histidine kinase
MPATRPRRRRWSLSPATSPAERLVIGALAVAFALVAWGGWMLWRSMEHHRATADETLRDHAAYMSLNYRGMYQTQTWFAVRTLLVAAQDAAAAPRAHPTSALVDEAVRRAIGPDVPALVPLRFFRRHAGEWQSTSSDGWVDVALRQALDTMVRDSLPPDASYLTVVIHRSTDSSLAFVEPRRDAEGWVGFEVAIADFAEKVFASAPARTQYLFESRYDSLGLHQDKARVVPFNVRIVAQDSTELFAFGGRIDDGWSMHYPFWSALPALISFTIGPDAIAYLMPGGYPPAPGPRVAAVIALALLVLGGAGFVAWRALSLARMRQAFTSSVSHELRTPLANIHLYAETLMLERVTEPAARRAALETITREARRLGDMVENVLASGRMARADEQIEVQPEDVGRLVDEVLDAFKPLLASRRIRVEVDRLGPDIAILDGSATRRILVNLLDNAIRHGPDGQRLRIVADNRDDAVLLVVEDEGPGIPRLERERVWLPFARGADGGSGLGLAVVRHLARLHGGDAVVGDHEHGARIEVRLAAATEVR